MGWFRMGPPQELLLELISEFHAPVFIETGTYRGDTAAWASRHFQSVYTIEKDMQLYKEAFGKYASLENITFILGDSRIEIEKLARRIQSPAVYWLDAHWSGGATYGKNDQCPLAGELSAIGSARSESIILIDDARLFLSPPPPPHDAGQWPDIASVIDILRSPGQGKHIVIVEDVIIAVPLRLKNTVISYCQKVNASAWEAYAKDQRTSEFQKGLALMKNDLEKRVKTSASRLLGRVVRAFGNIRAAL